MQRDLVARSRTEEDVEKAEKLADEATAAGLYVSRRNEFLLRVIVQVLRRTVVMKKKYKRPGFSYTRNCVFAPVREYSDVPQADGDAA